MTTVAATNRVKLTRWRGGQHPTQDKILRQLEKEGLRPYTWADAPNSRYPVRSHGYHKILYCVQGSLEVTFPATKQRVVLHSGDRLDMPRGVRYSAIVGPTGVKCAEGSQL